MLVTRWYVVANNTTTWVHHDRPPPLWRHEGPDAAVLSVPRWGVPRVWSSKKSNSNTHLTYIQSNLQRSDEPPTTQTWKWIKCRCLKFGFLTFSHLNPPWFFPRQSIRQSPSPSRPRLFFLPGRLSCRESTTRRTASPRAPDFTHQEGAMEITQPGYD